MIQSASEFIINYEKIKVPHFNNLYIYSCQFDINYYHADLFKQLNILYPLHINQACVKRQAEYLAGRYAASLALKHLCITGFDVLTGKHRSPIWPTHVLGSITHAHFKAHAIAVNRSNYQFIGIDYEKLISHSTAENIQVMILNKEEIKYLQDSHFNFPVALTILFSAKESLFKALYPYVGQYFDFSAASIISVLYNDEFFELELNQTLNNILIKGRRFKVWFSVEKHSVLTLIAL